MLLQFHYFLIVISIMFFCYSNMHSLTDKFTVNISVYIFIASLFWFWHCLKTTPNIISLILICMSFTIKVYTAILVRVFHSINFLFYYGHFPIIICNSCPFIYLSEEKPCLLFMEIFCLVCLIDFNFNYKLYLFNVLII